MTSGTAHTPPKRSSAPGETIALFGYYGVGNLGDEAVVSALVRSIRLRRPEARVIGISINPDDTRSRHGIDALPIRRMYVPPEITVKNRLLRAAIALVQGAVLKLPAEIAFTVKTLAALRSVSMIVVAGSGAIYDKEHGPWSFPLTHFRWGLLCALTNTRTVYLSVGAGPFVTRLGRLFFRYALARASYRSFRDEASIEWMKAIGMNKESHLCPDMAFSMSGQLSAHGAKTNGASRPVRVGINALPRREWSSPYDEARMGYEQYVSIMAEFISALLDRGAEIFFFHSQIGDSFLDRDIIHLLKLRRTDQEWTERVICGEARTPDELFGHIASMDLIVASRFHAILFAYLLGRPVLGLSYHPKTDDLMERVGQRQFVMDIRSITAPELLRNFDALQDSVHSGAWSIDPAIFERYRLEVERQFDDVFLQTRQ